MAMRVDYYPRIDDSDPDSEKIKILARQVVLFMEEKLEFEKAMQQVLWYRYNGRFRHKIYWTEVAFHPLVKEARQKRDWPKRAVQASRRPSLKRTWRQEEFKF